MVKNQNAMFSSLIFRFIACLLTASLRFTEREQKWESRAKSLIVEPIIHVGKLTF